MLHFVNAGFDFWFDKFRLLGSFDDGYKMQFKIPFDTMLQSRDLVAAATSADPATKEHALAKAERYYEATFVCKRHCRKRFEKHGLFATWVDVQGEKGRLEGRQAGAGGRGKGEL